MTLPDPRRAGLAALLAALALAGCSGGAAPQLADVLEPDLARLCPAVAAQLGERRRALDALRDRGDRVRLGAAWGEMGRLYHAYRLDAPAAACYRNALQLEPRSFRWHYYLGQLAVQTGDTEVALGHLEEAVALAPDDVPARVALGRLSLLLDRPDAAREQLEAALAREPHHAVARFMLAQLAADGGDPAAAVRHYEAALEAQPEATGIHYPLALAHRAVGDEARAALHLAQRGDRGLTMPDPLMAELATLGVGAEVHIAEGAIAFRRGEFERAAAAFRRAVEAAPERADAHQNLASALVKLGDAAGAEAEFREALRLDAGSFAAHYSLGLLLDRLRRHDEAAAAFRSALTAEPDHAEARLRLAHATRKRGDCAAALAEYAALLERHPESAAAALGAARCQLAEGRRAAALALLERPHARAPADDALAAALARVLATGSDVTVHDGERAVSIAEGLLARARSLEHVETAAMAHAAAGRFERAVELQQAALDAAAAAGRADLVAALRANLEAYRRGARAAAPWTGDD